METEKLIGTVSHYYSKIGVAVLELVDTLRLGDSIRIVGGIDTDFIQTVESMEIEHEKIEEAKTGDSIGLKVNHRARKGYRVYKE
ncbi:hypothetical protein KJA15_02970 [Patescibacteria group bacterium]|nr:hypothetical protein [Patescibacteria group bacterium]